MTPRLLAQSARLAGTPLLRCQSDERLVDLARQGHERAFEAIVQRYRGPLLRYCSKLLPPNRAEDAVQQAFVNAHGAISRGSGDLHLRAWLYRIAHNASLNLLRQNGWDHEELSPDLDGVERPDQAFERSQSLRAVIDGVQALPERQRAAIVLRELEGRSHDEIAAELGVGRGAVRQLLHRARLNLRAAATVLTPPGLLVRIPSSSEGQSLAARVAEASAGAGAAATLAKVGATVAVTGAIAGGAAYGPMPGGGNDRDASVASAAPAPAETAEAGREEAAREPDAGRDRHDDDGRRRGGGEDEGDRDDDRGDDRGRGGDDEPEDDGDDDRRHEDVAEDRSGPGDGDGEDRSGPGSGELIEDRSGSGESGSGDSGSGSSGSGSGDSGEPLSSGPGGGDSSGSGGDSSGSGDRDGDSSGPG